MINLDSFHFSKIEIKRIQCHLILKLMLLTLKKMWIEISIYLNHKKIFAAKSQNWSKV